MLSADRFEVEDQLDFRQPLDRQIGAADHEPACLRPGHTCRGRIDLTV